MKVNTNSTQETRQSEFLIWNSKNWPLKTRLKLSKLSTRISSSLSSIWLWMKKPSTKSQLCLIWSRTPTVSQKAKRSQAQAQCPVFHLHVPCPMFHLSSSNVQCSMFNFREIHLSPCLELSVRVVAVPCSTSQQRLCSCSMSQQRLWPQVPAPWVCS